MRNVSSTLVFSSINLKVFWHGRQMTPSATDFKLLQTLLRLLLAAVAFAVKRQRHKRQHQRAGFLRRARQHGADAAARATAQPGNNEYHFRAFTSAFERGELLLGHCAAAFGIAARADAPQESVFELNLQRGG